jgi:hypothetical protein
MDAAGLQQRVSTLLLDMTQLTFPATLVSECLRQAVLAYSRSSGRPETLAGLDSALETSVPEVDGGLLVLGAAGFAASLKGVDRKEAFNLETDTGALVVELGERLLARFEALLLTVQRDRMRMSTVQPWGAGWLLDI